MKHHKNHDSENHGSQLVPVRFEFAHPTATHVFVAGTFNHWQPDNKPMQSAGPGRWVRETALAPGSYEYCLVVDGHWIPDPQSHETVANPFGGRNSVLTVFSSPEKSHLVAAANLPLKNTNQPKKKI